MKPRQLLEQLVEVISCKPVLTRKDLARRYGVDLDTVDRWHARGTLPRAFYLPGSRFPAWRPADVDRWERTSAFLRKKISRD